MPLEVKISESFQKERRERKIIPIIMETIENEGYGPAKVYYDKGSPYLGGWIWARELPKDEKLQRFTTKWFSILETILTIKSLRKSSNRIYPLIKNIGVIDPNETRNVATRNWSSEIWNGTTIGRICYCSSKDSLKIEIFGEKFTSQLKKLGEVLYKNTQLKPKLELITNLRIPARIYKGSIEFGT